VHCLTDVGRKQVAGERGTKAADGRGLGLWAKNGAPFLGHAIAFCGRHKYNVFNGVINMNANQPKKIFIMNILDVLKKYTDENHRLSQKEIMDLLESECGIKADRKTVKRNLMNLIEFGYRVKYSESVRANSKGVEELVCSDWYLEREFDDAELRLLIDGLLFSKRVPHTQCRQLINKLEGLGNTYFKSGATNIRNLPETFLQNKQVLSIIEVLDEAIEKRLQVSFSYCGFDVDKRLHPRLSEDGMLRTFVVSPYQIIATNGRYYLACNYDKSENLAINCRLDRICDIRLLDTPAKSTGQVKGLENGLELPRRMVESIYMFGGRGVKVSFRASRLVISEIIDWFGSDVTFTDVTDEELTVVTTVNENAMRHWAMQYAGFVTVLSPEHLADAVKADILSAAEKYGIEMALPTPQVEAEQKNADTPSERQEASPEKEAEDATLAELIFGSAAAKPEKKAPQPTAEMDEEQLEGKLLELEKLYKKWSVAHVFERGEAMGKGSFSKGIAARDYFLAPGGARVLFVFREPQDNRRLQGRAGLFRPGLTMPDGKYTQKARIRMQGIIRGIAADKRKSTAQSVFQLENELLSEEDAARLACVSIDRRYADKAAGNAALKSYAARYSEYLMRELELLEPDYIVCCGTYGYVSDIIASMPSCGKSAGKFKQVKLLRYPGPAFWGFLNGGIGTEERTLYHIQGI